MENIYSVRYFVTPHLFFTYFLTVFFFPPSWVPIMFCCSSKTFLKALTFFPIWEQIWVQCWFSTSSSSSSSSGELRDTEWGQVYCRLEQTKVWKHFFFSFAVCYPNDASVFWDSELGLTSFCSFSLFNTPWRLKRKTARLDRLWFKN